jgi:soluble lytic murein transglycosylase-like protein
VFRRAASVAVLLACPALLPATARADIYTFIDKDGVQHFTNVQPPKSKRQHWRTVYATGPGKAGVVSGASTAGCKRSRADVVAATDKSPLRYVRYDAYIAEASRLYAIPEALIRAVIKVESDYDPRVVSCAGAKGLMQVMPYEETSEHIEHVFDPRENILAGTRMLRTKANHWNGDLKLTIASYHAGVGAVTKYHGVPPYATTQQYVQWVLKQYDRFRTQELAQAGGGG